MLRSRLRQESLFAGLFSREAGCLAVREHGSGVSGLSGAGEGMGAIRMGNKVPPQPTPDDLHKLPPKYLLAFTMHLRTFPILETYHATEISYRQ